MRKLKILITGVGSPEGGAIMADALKNNPDGREVELIGTDMDPESVGRHFVDRFYRVPAGRAEGFLPHLLRIVEQERPDVVLPQLSDEVAAVARARGEFEALGTKVICSSAASIRVADDKLLTYREMEAAGVAVPEYAECNSLAELGKAAYALGYPERRVCFKPRVGKGSRGFVVLAPPGTPRGEALLGRGRVPLTLYEANDMLKSAKPFPRLVVMEYIEASEEHTVDLFCEDGRALMGYVKTRERVNAGLGYLFRVADRSDLRAIGEKAAAVLGLSGFACVQTMDGKLTEVNPRNSVFPRQANFDMPWECVKYVLEWVDRAHLKRIEGKLRAGATVQRYYRHVYAKGE